VLKGAGFVKHYFYFTLTLLLNRISRLHAQYTALREKLLNSESELSIIDFIRNISQNLQATEQKEVA